MGRLDLFIIEYELPIPGLPKLGWQSKSLECASKFFTLTTAGRLQEEVEAIEIVDNEVRFTDTTKIIDRNYEGVFTVHQSVGDMWYEFEIAMIDGEVKLIKTQTAEKLNRCENAQ